MLTPRFKCNWVGPRFKLRNQATTMISVRLGRSNSIWPPKKKRETQRSNQRGRVQAKWAISNKLAFKMSLKNVCISTFDWQMRRRARERERERALFLLIRPISRKNEVIGRKKVIESDGGRDERKAVMGKSMAVFSHLANHSINTFVTDSFASETKKKSEKTLANLNFRARFLPSSCLLDQSRFKVILTEIR